MYAGPGCQRRVAAQQKGPLPKCAYCHVLRVKGHRKKYCSRECAGYAVAEARTLEQMQRSAKRLNALNHEKYMERRRADIESICNELGMALDPQTFETVLQIALKVWPLGYKSGFAVGHAQRTRERKRDGQAA